MIKNLRENLKNIEIQFSPEFKDIRPFQWFNYNNKNKKRFFIENKFTSYINLNQINLDNFLESEVYKNMETVRRYDYRTAIKEKAKLTISKDLSVFIEFYKNLFSKQKKVSKKYLIELQKELNNIIKIGKGLMFHVEDKIGNILYTLFYIWEKDKAYYYLGAGNPKINKSWQSVFGHCEIFKYLNKKYDINQVDLEGVNSPLRGWFKLSLGGNLTQYYKVKIDFYESKKSPVNKGHSFDLETKDRIDAFKRKISKGWEEEYKEYRNLWEELPKNRTVRDYPLLVDLETVSRCNLSCPMCPTVTQEFLDKRVLPFKRGQMDLNLAKKIIDEVAGKIYSLRLSWIGEPTLHSKLVEIAKYAKDKNKRDLFPLQMDTNFIFEYFKKLVDAGVDLITVSIDGMDEVYNKIRKPLKFDETLKKLTDIANFKKKK